MVGSIALLAVKEDFIFDSLITIIGDYFGPIDNYDKIFEEEIGGLLDHE